jgi:hypothetical protein
MLFGVIAIDVTDAFPLARPACGGEIWLIAFIVDPRPIRKILMHVGEPEEPPPVSPARGPRMNWDELIQAQNTRDVVQAAEDDLPVTDPHSI